MISPCLVCLMASAKELMAVINCDKDRLMLGKILQTVIGTLEDVGWV